MKILMIFPGMIDDLPPILSSSSCLSKFGATVVVCAFGCNKKTKTLLEIENVKVISNNCARYPDSNFLKIKMKIKFRVILRSILREENFDVFWLHGAQGLGLINYLPKGKKIVAHAHEIYDSFRYRVIQKRGIRKSDVLIVPEVNRKWFLQISSKKFLESFVVPNRIQKKYIVESEKNYTRKVFIDNGGSDSCRKFFIYQGLFGAERCLSQLIEGFLRVNKNNIGLILLGDGSDKNYIKYIKDLAINENRIVFIDKIPHPGHLKVTCGCFAGIILYSPTSLNNIYCAPNKIYEYTSYGLGMLLPHFPGMEKIVDKYNVGVTCVPDDVNSIKEGLEELISKDQEVFKKRAKNFLDKSPTVESEYAKVFFFLNRDFQ